MKSLKLFTRPGAIYKAFTFIILAPVLALITFLIVMVEIPQSSLAMSKAPLKDSISSLDTPCITNVIVSRQTKNLIPDPGFEESIPENVWLTDGKCAFSHNSTIHYEDGYSAQIINSSGNADECYWQTKEDVIPIKGNWYYDFSCRVNSNLNSGEAHVQINFLDEKYHHLRGTTCSSNSATQTNGVWVEMTGSERAPSDARYAQIRAGISGSSSEGEVWIDDCFLGSSVDLQIGKKDYPEVVQHGGLLTYTITYTNSGRQTANAQLIENYDNEVVFQSANPAPKPGLNNFWDIGPLPPATAGTITVTVKVRDDATRCTLVNYVDIQSNETEATISDLETTTISGCTPPECQVSIIPFSYAQGNAVPGEKTYYNFSIINTGSQAGVVITNVNSSRNWLEMIGHSLPYTLSAADSMPVAVDVLIPDEPARVISGSIDVTILTATLQCNAATSINTAIMTTTVKRNAAVKIEPDYFKLPSLDEIPLKFTHTVTNTGNWTDTIDLITQTYPNTLPITIEPPSPLTIGPGTSTQLTMTIQGTPNLAVVTITAVSGFDRNKSDEVTDKATSHSINFLPVVIKQGYKGSDEVINGDFENGLDGWGTMGELPVTVAKCEDDCAVLLGDPDFPPEAPDSIPMGKGSIYQMVCVPNVASPNLTFDYEFYSYDDSKYDYLQITINSIDNPIWKIGNTTDQYPFYYPENDHRIDLSQYRGKCVVLYFSLWNTNSPQYNSWAYLDNIRLNP